MVTLIEEISINVLDCSVLVDGFDGDELVLGKGSLLSLDKLLTSFVGDSGELFGSLSLLLILLLLGVERT